MVPEGRQYFRLWCQAFFLCVPPERSLEEIFTGKQQKERDAPEAMRREKRARCGRDADGTRMRCRRDVDATRTRRGRCADICTQAAAAALYKPWKQRLRRGANDLPVLLLCLSRSTALHRPRSQMATHMSHKRDNRKGQDGSLRCTFVGQSLSAVLISSRRAGPVVSQPNSQRWWSIFFCRGCDTGWGA